MIKESCYYYPQRDTTGTCESPISTRHYLWCHWRIYADSKDSLTIYHAIVSHRLTWVVTSVPKSHVSVHYVIIRCV